MNDRIRFGDGYALVGAIAGQHDFEPLRSLKASLGYVEPRQPDALILLFGDSPDAERERLRTCATLPPDPIYGDRDAW